MDLTLLADPVFLAQNVVDGVSRGALYAVYAMGFTLIFGVLDIINLAHAATFMWCAFAGWIVMSQLGLPLPAGAGRLHAGRRGVAALLELLAFRPCGAKAPTACRRMISSIGASLIMVSIAEAVFGVNTRRFPDSVLDPRPFFLGGSGGCARQPGADPDHCGAAFLLTLALGLFIRRTRMGKAIRAIAADQSASRLLGINVNAVVIVTFLVAGALAGAAGILVGLLTNNIVPGHGRADRASRPGRGHPGRHGQHRGGGAGRAHPRARRNLRHRLSARWKRHQGRHRVPDPLPHPPGAAERHPGAT